MVKKVPAHKHYYENKQFVCASWSETGFYSVVRKHEDSCMEKRQQINSRSDFGKSYDAAWKIDPINEFVWIFVNVCGTLDCSRIKYKHINSHVAEE